MSYLSPTPVLSHSSPLDALIDVLRQQGRHILGGESPVAAVLWTDPDEQWKTLVPVLQEHLPQLFVLGDYVPVARRGPAIWLKCVVDRTIDVGLEADVVPILYLPGIGRQQLRGTDTLTALGPLVELQYRGTVWSQRNGKDWTVEAFVVSDDALALPLGRDERTRQALRHALLDLMRAPLQHLHGKPLDADRLNALMVPDAERQMLQWMNDPEGTRKAMSPEQWAAFHASAQDRYGIDVDKEGALVAAERLGLKASKAWKQLNDRWAEMPAHYERIPELLGRAQPKGTTPADASAWPDENKAQEDALREALQACKDLSPAKCRSHIEALEAQHAHRRQWVWVKLGHSPLAKALEHLHTIAILSAEQPKANSLQALSEAYQHTGHRVDLAALRALAEVERTSDRTAVTIALRALYLPWLTEQADRFQALVGSSELPTPQAQGALVPAPGTCVLFVDGLRWDLGTWLQQRVQQYGMQAALQARWSALPSVTATAKPAVAPFMERIGASDFGADFVPNVGPENKPLNRAQFLKQLNEVGVDFIEPDSMGDATLAGWTEFGDIDKMGHDLTQKLPAQSLAEVDRIAHRINELLKAGWESVQVVTDHGWLLMPGGLPKQELPTWLTETKWGRCALLRDGARSEVQRVPWSWGPSVDIAMATGIHVFREGIDYAHGGLSLQECLIPVLTVTRSAKARKKSVGIKDVKWTRMRCRVTLDQAIAGVTVEVRRTVGDDDALASKLTDDKGHASLVVEDEDLLGTHAVIVVLDQQLQLLAKHDTRIGND